MTTQPVFIDLSLDDQALELRVYLKSLGAEISDEKSSKGIEDDLHKIIGVCDACFQESNEADIESVLNSIVSMLVLINPERAENLILAFSEKLSKASDPKLGAITLRVLWLLFQSLEPTSSMRYHVYYHLVKIAKSVDQIKSVFTDVDHLKQQFALYKPSNEQIQKLYRLLHQALLASKQSELAAKVMIELLSTYTAENASQAREDAQSCILAALADPNTFLLHPLLTLKPVNFLKGELIHDLLNIFVSEKVNSYLDFYKEHKEYVVNKLGLDHQENLRKMRLLTFMQLAEIKTEMTFDQIQKDLDLNPSQIEAFIIDVLKTKLVRARMDQAARKVYISSTMHRTFGRAQWQQLRDVLSDWKTNLGVVQGGMKSFVSVMN